MEGTLRHKLLQFKPPADCGRFAANIRLEQFVTARKLPPYTAFSVNRSPAGPTARVRTTKTTWGRTLLNKIQVMKNRIKLILLSAIAAVGLSNCMDVHQAVNVNKTAAHGRRDHDHQHAT